MSAAEKGEYVEGMECVRCGESWDSLMGQPAVKQAGWNWNGGVLYDCRVCNERFTEAEVETGLSLSELVRSDFEGFDPGSYSDYASTGDPSNDC